MTVKNFVLGIGIIVVFALVLWQGIEAFYPSPQYDQYCTPEISRQVIETAEQCNEADGTWTPQNIQCVTAPCPQGYCDVYTKCNDEYNQVRNAHSKVVFFIAVIVGIIALIVGYTILSIEPVGSALIGAGVWSFFWGTVNNWGNLSDIWRFLLLLVALIILIYIAVHLNSQKKKGFLQKIGFGK